MRRRGHRRKSRCRGTVFSRSHRCDCEAPLRGRTSPGRRKTPATRPNHSFRHHAPVPRPVAPAEARTLVLRTMNSRGRYSHWYSPIGVNASIRSQMWSVRLRIATPAIRVIVGVRRALVRDGRRALQLQGAARTLCSASQDTQLEGTRIGGRMRDGLANMGCIMRARRATSDGGRSLLGI
jgi:hypothetical protein